jgi:hypothetical protein
MIADRDSDEVVTQGLIYVAKGERYVAQARVSARSAKALMPGVHITLFSDNAAPDLEPFDQNIPLESCGDPYRDKILCMARSPYASTLFLDVDTYVCSDLGELWPLLRQYDIAAAHAPNRIAHGEHVHPFLRALPPSFPEFNTGVLLYRQSAAVSELMSSWLASYDLVDGASLPSKDQPPFRLAMHNSVSIRHVTLIPEYNCRIGMAGFINRPVSILHAVRTEPEFEHIAATVARELGERWNARVVFLADKLYAADGRVLPLRPG